MAILGLKLAYGHPMEPETDVVFGLKTEPKTEKSVTVDAPMEIDAGDSGKRKALDVHGQKGSGSGSREVSTDYRLEMW